MGLPSMSMDVSIGRGTYSNVIDYVCTQWKQKVTAFWQCNAMYL